MKTSRAGVFEPTARRVTIEDVARAAGVSRQTVSRATNDKGEIDPATRQRVLDVARSLGYRPNRFARAMVRQETVTLGLLLPNITNPFFPEVANGILESAAERGWHVVIQQTGATPEGEQVGLDLFAGQADAFVGYLEFDESVRRATEIGIPFALFGYEGSGSAAAAVNRVDIDLGSGLAAAIRHLVGLGHREIGILDAGRPVEPGGTVSPRGRIMLDLLREAGLAADPGCLQRAANSVAGGERAVARLAEERPGVTAVLAYNDIVAVGAVRGLRALGRSVPDDCAVAGFDGLGLAELVEPTLTTLYVDKRSLGAEAVRLVAAEFGRSDRGPSDREPRVSVVRPELVVRASTAGAAVPD
ncbi:LacI family DNA-binding transcriptional regulator [Kitasatospora sp. NPDC001527]|uniref:LacI family DNA-binding transcriptional regulator n=1 Tax=Kitasatospora sp. NPDC001527 TaxID=3154519 RepID=UPI00331E8CDE